MEVEPIHVAAGVISDAQGNILLARRLPGTHLAGQWEFPGGKTENDETPEQGLRRELMEELAIEMLDARPLIAFEHRYPDKHVKLDVWRVGQYRGEPRAVEGHELAWVSVDSLHDVELLAADKPIVSAIELPDQYAISTAEIDTRAFLSTLDATLSTGYRLIQIRAPELMLAKNIDLLGEIAKLCNNTARWLLNGDPDTLLKVVQGCCASGIHMPARYLGHYETRPIPDELLFAVSCHNRDELKRACALAADFAVLGPVKPTPSHPQAMGMGWSEFAALIDGLPLPVYAIGGMQKNDKQTAWAHGAQGISGISDFWAVS